MYQLVFCQIACGRLQIKRTYVLLPILFLRSGRIVERGRERVARARSMKDWKFWIIEFCSACVGSAIRNSLLIYFNAQIIKKNRIAFEVNELISTISKRSRDDCSFESSRWVEWRRLFSFIILRLVFVFFFCFCLLNPSPTLGRALSSRGWWLPINFDANLYFSNCEFLFVSNSFWCGESRMHSEYNVRYVSTGLARFRRNGISHGMHVYGVSMRANESASATESGEVSMAIKRQKNPRRMQKEPNIATATIPYMRLELGFFFLLLLFAFFFYNVGRKQSYLSMFEDWLVSAVFSHFHYTRGEIACVHGTFTYDAEEEKKKPSRRGNNYKYIDLRSILVPVILF